MTLTTDRIEPVTRPGHAGGGGPSAWGAAWGVALAEWRLLGRDARGRLLLGLTLALMLGALGSGLLRLDRLDDARREAEAGDRDAWTGQGAKNPHSAAHFGQYAFKPAGPLAAADPGVDEFAGNAVYLEAHRQNEAAFRAARDGATAARSGRLSLAFVLQAILPLTAILLGASAFAGEREAGTLAMMLGQGARPVDLLRGKALAGAAVLLGLLAVALGGVVGGLALTGRAPAGPGEGARLAGMFAAHALYLLGYLGLALAVSARAGSTRGALAALLGFWLAGTFIAPRVATDLARRIAPLPTADAFKAELAEAKKAQFGHDPNHPAFAAFRDRVLKDYGVARVEDLPVSFRGLSLRADDEAGYAIFDQHYGRLRDKVARQDRIRAAAGAALPLLALQPASMAMAGTDNAHHDAFTRAAEAHRRAIQSAASGDLIAHARNGDPDYRAPADLWATIPPFRFERPAASEAWRSQAGNLAALAAWCAGAALLAWLSAARPRVVGS